MNKLVYYKTNPGNRGEGRSLYMNYEGLDGCEILKSDSQVEIFRNGTPIIKFALSKIEEDSFSVTYMAEHEPFGKVRICCINPRLAARFGDTITFASIHKDGFAVHYEIE